MTSRLDLVVAKRFGLTRSQAAAAIMAGRVSREGQPLTKAGQPVPEDAPLKYDGSVPSVSRAGEKLGTALDAWQVSVSGLAALDVGSSTGGFTEALLERGASQVIAVDVGTGQLAWKLRRDSRVISLEQTDIRKLKRLPHPVDLAVIDVSFISLQSVLPAVRTLIGSGKPVIALFKPQFEVGKAIADRHRGVITDSKAVDEAAKRIRDWLDQHGWKQQAEVQSSVPGSKGNVERLLLLRTPAR